MAGEVTLPTDSDMATLRNAARALQQEQDGIFPRTIGDRSHFAKLVRRGWLQFVDWGRDSDGVVERDVELYELTDSGKAILDARHGAKP